MFANHLPEVDEHIPHIVGLIEPCRWTPNDYAQGKSTVEEGFPSSKNCRAFRS